MLLDYLGVGEVNVAFNVNPSSRTAASEVKFLQHHLRFVVSDSGGVVVLTLANHAIQLVYDVLGRGALVEAQCPVPAFDEKSRPRRTDLFNNRDECVYTYVYRREISLMSERSGNESLQPCSA